MRVCVEEMLHKSTLTLKKAGCRQTNNNDEVKIEKKDTNTLLAMCRILRKIPLHSRTCV